MSQGANGSQASTVPLRIRHVPSGIEDPYTRQAWERCPREPRSGDVVKVAAVSEPKGSIQTLNVELLGANEGWSRISAITVPYDGDGDRWEATLGSFPTAMNVTYRFEGRSSDDKCVTSETFSFETLGWHAFQTIEAWDSGPTQGVLYFADESGNRSAVAIEFAGAGILRIRAWPVAPAVIPATPGALPCTIRSKDGQLIVDGGNVRIRFGISDGLMQVESVLEASAVVGAGINRYQPRWLSTEGGPFLSWLGARIETPHAIRMRLSLSEDEALYGTGERFDQFNRRGLSFDTRVYEQYKNQGSRTYLPVPLLLSSRGWALTIEGTRPLQIDAGTTGHETLDITSDVERDSSASMGAYVYLADAPLDALQMHLQCTDLPVMPPDWIFGLWMSSNDWNSQERVMREVERGEQEDIPGDVVVIEAWSDEATFYIWNDAQYDPIPPDRPPRLSDFRFPAGGRWPDPKSMIAELHRKGARLLLWQIPLMKEADAPHTQQAQDFETTIQRGWCAKNADGTPYRNPGWWFPEALLPDLTGNEAAEWWLSRRRYLVEEMGVDGFKTDGGEHVWGRELRFADGRRGDQMINAYPVVYAAAYHRLMRDCGRIDGLTFSRSGYAGSQRYPAHWAGDENSTWEAFRHSIIAGLTAGASGIPFWGWDIAGFSEEIPSGELYRRSWMMATFCPIMQYHSEYNGRREPSRDRTPWNIAERTGDPYVLPVCRIYTDLRRQLRPYIIREARHTAATGRPLMCSLLLEYPSDPDCLSYPYQYLFGRDLLVAPTVEEGMTAQHVYLPAGGWLNLWTGQSLEGPLELIVAVPPDHIPVFVRPGAIPPLDNRVRKQV